MSKHELCNVLLKWLQTFQLDESSGARYTTLADITDGVAMAQVLHQIAPEWFSNRWLAKIKTDVGENWRLKVSNLKKIIEGVADYYLEFVNQNTDFVKPDAVKIGEQKNATELAKLLQLILGCAVNCQRKQDYIEKIMRMEESVQNVIMQSIQEVEQLLGSAPLSFSSSFGGSCTAAGNVQMEQLVAELQSAVEARDRFSVRCEELEHQLNTVHDEKNQALDEKHRLEAELHRHTDDPMKDVNLRKQIDALNEKIFKLETSRDDYRLKLEIQEKEMNDLRFKYDGLQSAAVEARHLKDEVDILREDADKVAKLESTIDAYKKKLEELSELKCHVKRLEDEHLQYTDRNLELETELKKANGWKTQADVYKKQVAELRVNLAETTKKLDKIEFENTNAFEKLNALQKEKERLIIERDALKEANDELLCNKFQHKENVGGHGELSSIEGESNTLPDTMMSVIEIKRQLIKLQHENALLKNNQKQSDNEKLPVLQTMLDDVTQQYKQLQIDNRHANQRILQLESELKETNIEGNVKSPTKGGFSTALKDLQNQLQSERILRTAESAEKDRLAVELKHVKTVLFDSIAVKDQEYEDLEDKYRKCLEKARSVAKSLDFPELHSVGEQINLLRNKVAEKDVLEEAEKRLKQHKLLKDKEEKMLASVFYNFAQRRQHESMDQRLINSNTVTGGNLSFLARQRQSASRRTPMAYNSK